MPKWVKDKVELAELVALRAAIQLGVTTNAANEHVEMHVDDKGVTRSKKIRDSDGEPRAATLRGVGKEAKEKKVKPRATTSSPKAVGEPALSLNVPDELAPGNRRSRTTTIHGYVGKRAAARRQKVLIAGHSKATTATPPTKEWLLREGAKLAEAANHESFKFLSPQQRTEVTTEATVPGLVSQKASVTGRSCKPLERPKRVRPGDSAASAAKKTRLSVLELVQ